MNYLPFVNIKQGSASVHRFSNGNTLPLTQRPFGMAAFAPQTKSDSSWFYHPADRCLEGVRLTHQPSPWIADYGSLILMPQNGTPAFSAGGRWSGYRPEEAALEPSYIRLRFLRSRCTFELTPTVRGAAVRAAFDGEKNNYLSFLSLYGAASARYVPEEETLYMTVTNGRERGAVNFTMYAVVRFGSGQVCASGHIAGNEEQSAEGCFAEGEGAGIHLKLTGSRADMKLAASYIGFDQAKRSLERETQGESFDEIKQAGDREWERRLRSVEIDSDDPDQMRTFYSCMYRAFLYPHQCWEPDENGAPVHYCPSDGTVKPGVRYTDNGFWDTYRTVYPFFALVAKEDYKAMCESFVNDYLECGWLPRWPSIGERGCMPSTLIDAVLCDAAVKGILTGSTLQKAFEGMLKHANVNSPNDDYGRSGAESYVRLGYVPIEAHKESVNLTLDAAYGDWCIARIAELLEKPDIAAEYDRRAKNYAKLFDPQTGFMRARHENGAFRAHFCPTDWGRDYTEGSAWQNSFAVPHDIEGLASLYGGKDALEKKIDELFATPPVYGIGGYGCEIHEMTEMAAADFGQCAVSNQPSFHIPYIYAALGNVEKTSYWTQRMCKELFSWRDDGFPGDEDNGSMALWYVFSTIGIYPFCPGKNEFVRTKRLAKSVKLNGRPFDADAYASNTVPYADFIE